ASSRTIGLARWPAGPVTRIFLPSTAPHHPDRHEATVPALVGEPDEQRQAIGRVADRLDGGDERADPARRQVVDAEAVGGGTDPAGVAGPLTGRLLDEEGGAAAVEHAVHVAQRLVERRLVGAGRAVGLTERQQADELVDRRSLTGDARRVE